MKGLGALLLMGAAAGMSLVGMGLGAGRADAQATPLPPGTSDTASPQGGVPKLAAGAHSLADAETRLAEGDYAGAQMLLDPYVSAHPADARALFDRGYLADAQQHTTAAEADYRKAIAADPEQFESRLALGLLLAGRGEGGPSASNPEERTRRQAEARTQLEAATRLQPAPANPAAQAQAGRALARLLYKNDPEAARQALLAALKLSSETTADTLLTAEIAENAGDPETAEQAYRGVLAGAPAAGDEVLQATGGLAHLLITAGKNTEAELLLRKALIRNAGDPGLNAQLARVLMEEGEPEEAIAVLETLHGALPKDDGVARMLADLYTQNGQAGKADALYVQLLGDAAGASVQAPDEVLLASRGDNLIRQKRFAEAVTILQRAVQLDAGDGNAWSSLAFAASETHQAQLTLDALAMRSKVMTETPSTYFLAATACDTLHQTKRAVEMYKQFLAVAGGKFPDEEWEAKHRLTALVR